MTAYEAALQQLSQATTATFLAERKRLATELREKGEKGDAARIELRRKPTASAWAVNQLYWHARTEFEAMLAAAASLRKGDVSASKAYRQSLAKLHARAAGILKGARARGERPHVAPRLHDARCDRGRGRVRSQSSRCTRRGPGPARLRGRGRSGSSGESRSPTVGDRACDVPARGAARQGSTPSNGIA